MSETSPAYAIPDRQATSSVWRCRKCGEELCIVSDGEGWIHGLDVILGKGQIDKVICPSCGHANEWRQYDSLA